MGVEDAFHIKSYHLLSKDLRVILAD